MADTEGYDWHRKRKLETNCAYDFGIFRDDTARHCSLNKTPKHALLSKTTVVLLLMLGVVILMGWILKRSREIDSRRSSSELRYRQLLTPSPETTLKTTEVDDIRDTKRFALTGNNPNQYDLDAIPLTIDNFEKLTNIVKSIPVLDINNLAESSGRTILQPIRSSKVNVENDDTFNNLISNDSNYDYKHDVDINGIHSELAVPNRKRTLLLTTGRRNADNKITIDNYRNVDNISINDKIKNAKFGEFDEVYENNEVEYAQLNAYRNFRKVKSVADIIDYLQTNFDKITESSTAIGNSNESTTIVPTTTRSDDKKLIELSDNDNVTINVQDHNETSLEPTSVVTESGNRSVEDNSKSYRHSRNLPLRSSLPSLFTNDEREDSDNDDDDDNDNDYENDGKLNDGISTGLRRFSNRMYRKRRRNNSRPTTQYDLDYFLKPPTPYPEEISSLSLTPPPSPLYTETVLNDGSEVATQFKNNFAEPPSYYRNNHLHHHRYYNRQQERQNTRRQPMKPISLMMEIFPVNRPVDDDGGVSIHPVTGDDGNGWLAKDGDQSNSILSGQLPWRGGLPFEDKKMWLRINLYPPRTPNENHKIK